MPIIRQTVGFVVAWLTIFGKKKRMHNICLLFQIASNSGSSVVSLVLFLAGSCFYVKKKPQRPSCGCGRNSKNHIYTEVR